MRVWWFVAVVGCGGASVAPASENAWISQAVTKPPHAAFSTVPADLIDDAAIARIKHRVRVRRFDRASVKHGEMSKPVIDRAQPQEFDRVLGVIGESSNSIRVVVEDDDARLAMWIDRRDTWPTLLVPMQLGDREGRVAKRAGVFLETGASIVARRPLIDVAFGRDRMRHVTLRDPDLVADGWVPASVVGHVYIAPPGDVLDLDSSTWTKSYRAPSDTRPRAVFVEHATIRVAPDTSAAIVATVVGKQVLASIARAGEWTEVEVTRPSARIHGFVQKAELGPATDEFSTGGTGGGHGFGMSHTQRFVVPASTCLYDEVQGQVAGVQIKESERYGERETGVDGWSRVYVDSPWAVYGFFVHDTGSDPKQPVWESCAHR